MSESANTSAGPERPAVRITRPAPLLEQRWFRAFAIFAVLFWTLVFGLKICVGVGGRWNPHTSQHMAVRNALYQFVDTLRYEAEQGGTITESFMAHAGPLLERPALREFSLYLSPEIVVHGPDSQMPKITPLGFKGEGAPIATPGVSRDTFSIIAARRTGEDEALLWGMNAQRDIVFREFEIVRPSLE